MEVYRHCSGCRTNRPESSFKEFKTCVDCRARIKARRENTDTKAESIARRNRRHAEAVKQGRPVIEGEEYSSYEKTMYEKQGIKPLYTRFNDEDWDEWLEQDNRREQLLLKEKQAQIDCVSISSTHSICGACCKQFLTNTEFNGLCLSCHKARTRQGLEFFAQFIPELPSLEIEDNAMANWLSW